MRTAKMKILMTVLLLGAPTWAGAQAARPTTGAPEIFSATATAKNASGAISGTVEVRVSRYTPDFDRKTVEEALRLDRRLTIRSRGKRTRTHHRP